jgi:hypothetical protein
VIFGDTTLFLQTIGVINEENMVRTILALMAVLAFGVVLLGASPVYADLQDDVDQAATIIERFQAVPEKAIPQALLKDAKDWPS